MLFSKTYIHSNQLISLFETTLHCIHFSINIYLWERGGWLFLSVCVASQCDIGHNDYGIGKIRFPVLCCLVDNARQGNTIV